MRKGVAAVMLLLLAIVHAPGSAQALVFSLLPDFLALGTYEPMVLMLTGGRALLETRDGDNVDRVELLPATPVAIVEGDHVYRLVAVTDVELFTIYTTRSAHT